MIVRDIFAPQAIRMPVETIGRVKLKCGLWLDIAREDGDPKSITVQFGSGYVQASITPEEAAGIASLLSPNHQTAEAR